MNEIGVVIPFWLDRPDIEAVDIAMAADRLGYETLWIGEMVTFDAFALATAIGSRTDQIGLRIGPLAIGVRTPVSVALGLSSVARLTGSRVDVALGASSPVIVSNWHDRPWGKSAVKMRETVQALRGILEDGRADFTGKEIRTRGFRLRHALPERLVAVAAFGPQMTKVAAEEADEVVLNIVTPGIVARVRETVDAHAKARGQNPAEDRGLGDRRAQSGPGKHPPDGQTACGVPETTWLWRDVHRSWLRRPRRTRPQRRPLRRSGS